MSFEREDGIGMFVGLAVVLGFYAVIGVLSLALIKNATRKPIFGYDFSKVPAAFAEIKKNDR